MIGKKELEEKITKIDSMLKQIEVAYQQGLGKKNALLELLEEVSKSEEVKENKE